MDVNEDNEMRITIGANNSWMYEHRECCNDNKKDDNLQKMDDTCLT
jgi:hypothetical protein